MNAQRRVFALVLSAVGCAAVFASPGAYAGDRAQVSVGMGSLFVFTDSRRALMEADSLATVDLRVGVAVYTDLLVEAGYRYLGSCGETFAGGFDTKLSIHAIDLGARYELHLLPWLSAYGRGGASAARGATDLDDGGGRITAAAWVPGVFGAVGVTGRLPRSWFGGVDGADGGRGFTVGLGLEFGYAWFMSFGLDRASAARVDTPEGPAPHVQGPDLGALSVHGPTFQFRAALHF